MDNFLKRVEAAIAQHGLLAKGDAAVLAVSGGVDSMVLLHAMARLARARDWTFAVAHLNHQLRGTAAERDERFVAAAAAKLGLPFRHERADVRGAAREKGVSVEMAARALRHDFLARTARELKMRKVVLAHHADDQVELFFLRLLRGAGPQGLSGMDWMGKSPVDARITLVRPLLAESKASLQDAARAGKIAFRSDATNRSTDILRNRVRLRLLPLLRREFQPELDRVVLRAMDLLCAETEFVERATEKWLRGPRDDWAHQHVALQRHVLRAELLRLGVNPEFDLIERFRAEPAAWLSLRPDVECRRRSDGGLETRAKVKSAWAAASALAVEVARRGQAQLGELSVRWRIVKGSTRPKRPALDTEWFDAAAVGKRCTLRYWRAGDRFQPIGMKQAVKLQDIFVNQKVPRSRRHELLLATTAGGEIFWVEGLRIGERFKVTPRTRETLRWSWQRRLPAPGR